jgi:putative flavoprotein involved in K+ transport
MKTHYPVLVVGGGQAGLSMSYCLKERGIEHLVFEKEKIAHSWQTQRWDSFCLVTPNWQCKLPGYEYSGSDPQGFMPKDEILKYINAYVASFDPPVMEGVEVLSVRKNRTGFELTTSTGVISPGKYTADQVVIASGNYHKPKIPKIADRLPESILQIHSSTYKNPQSLPDGEVLVVGTGQSGCQIAEDLHLAGRQVHLCVGGAPRSPRIYRGKDVVEWLDQMRYYDLPIGEHPQREKVRTNANHYVTGRDGGREIDLRKFALEGMQLHGRLKDIRSGKLEFWHDLKQNLDYADAVSEGIKKTVDGFIENNQIQAPTEPAYQPVWQPPEAAQPLDYQDISSVVWSTGFQPDFRWVEIPVFDGKGYPGHERGITGVKGLYFLGLPWLYTWGSGRFSGIARDANYLVEEIWTTLRVTSPRIYSPTVEEICPWLLNTGLVTTDLSI